MSKRYAVLSLILVLGLAALPGCKKQPQVEPTPPEPVQAPPPAPKPAPPKEVKEDYPAVTAPKEEEPTVSELNRQGHLKTVYFDFDKYDLTEETRRTLRANADWIRTNGKYRVLIEGHCDERGTIEYNLALGERRANAVREYLASLGVSPSRLRIISYGEEQPAESGHNEQAWAKNRRGQFVIEK